MKQTIVRGIILSLGVQICLEARTMVTPLPVQRGALSKLVIDLDHCPWHVEIWGGGYHRSAQKSYDCTGCEVPLSQLFFNRSEFFVTDLLPAIDTPLTKNPLAAVSLLKPRVSYRECGTVLGLDAVKHVQDFWRTGLRVTLPVKSIRVKNPTKGTSTLGGLTLNDVLAQQPEVINGSAIKSYAFRLDILSKLPYTCNNGPGSIFPIVVYADPDFPPNNPITISNQDITNQQGTPVSALVSNTGTLPQEPWAFPQDQAQNLLIISSDGAVAAPRGRFDASINYSPLGADAAQQSTLFIVPSVASDGRTTPDSRVIQQQVDELRSCLDQEAEDVFKDCGISFASQKITGVGDLDTELYGGYLFSDCTYLEGFLGIRWPTGKRTRPEEVYRLPLGNNGHYEVKVGAQGLWQPCRWAVIHADLAGFIVLKHRECVSTAFDNSPLKNIGLPVSADVHWNYYLFHMELLVTPPSFSECGALIGYELYHKSRDSVRFCTSRAVNCLGTEEILDDTILEQNTEATSNKLRGELFLKVSDQFNFFAGGSKVIRGKNVPIETEWYLGLSFYY